MDLKTIQKLASDWSLKNFGPHFGDGHRNLLGIVEEVGELSHAHLKGAQGIKHTPEQIKAMKKDAVWDIVIFLCNYCDSQNIELEECVQMAWDEIQTRDFTKNKNGK